MDIEQIWSEFGQQLRGFIASRVSDAHIVDELSQELMIRVYQNLDSLHDKERVNAWLFRVARNVVNDYYRKMARENENKLAVMDELVESLKQESTHDLVYEELSHCLQPFVDKLPDNYRRTLTAVDLEGASQKLLADELGVSHSTIKSQMQRARVKLSKLFKQCCDFTVDARGNVISYEPKSGQCKCDCSS